MRHARGYRRLNRTHEHRKALFANMAGSLIEHEQIKTTLPKAKELRPYVEKLITLAKRGGLSNRRLAHARLLDDAQLVKLFDVIGPRVANRDGGYTRTIKLENRKGDNAPMANISLVLEETVSSEASRAARASMAATAAGEPVSVARDRSARRSGLPLKGADGR